MNTYSTPFPGPGSSAKPATVIPLITGRAGYSSPDVDADIIIPVYNEQQRLADSVRTLLDLFDTPGMMPYRCAIVIADNASTDGTWPIACDLATAYPHRVRAVRISRKGRGRALKITWGESSARVVAYMDVDLSTDIRYTGALIGSLLLGGADVAIGCRLFDESDVDRSLKREAISRTYNAMLRCYLGAAFHDAQCGFKALTARAAARLLPMVRDDEWFFDTELLMFAQTLGLRIYEIPVRWVEGQGTTVDIPDTVRKDLEGMARMRRKLHKMRRQEQASQQQKHMRHTHRTVSHQSAQSSRPAATSSSALPSPHRATMTATVKG